MLSNEIINILNKYAESNQDEIYKINQSIMQITQSLKSIRSNLSKQLQSIVDSDDVNDDGEKILNDINILKRQISNINASIIDISQYNSNNSITEFNNKIEVYIVSETICPVCNVKLDSCRIDYQTKISGQIINATIEWYKCPACGKLFALYIDIEEFNTNNTNIRFNSKYLQKLSVYEDIYVVTNISKCSSSDHLINDISCMLPVVLEDGTIDVIEVELAHCETCQKYIMLRYTYDELPGVPVCKIIDETKNSNNSKEEFNFGDTESKLSQYGYNVNCVDNLTEEQRHTILIIQLITQNMQRSEIISIISKNIANGEKRIEAGYKKDWSKAVKKWRADRDFVAKLDIDKCHSDINVNRIILKYTK